MKGEANKDSLNLLKAEWMAARKEGKVAIETVEEKKDGGVVAEHSTYNKSAPLKRPAAAVAENKRPLSGYASVAEEEWPASAKPVAAPFTPKKRTLETARPSLPAPSTLPGSPSSEPDLDQEFHSVWSPAT